MHLRPTAGKSFSKHCTYQDCTRCKIKKRKTNKKKRKKIINLSRISPNRRSSLKRYAVYSESPADFGARGGGNDRAIGTRQESLGSQTRAHTNNNWVVSPSRERSRAPGDSLGSAILAVHSGSISSCNYRRCEAAASSLSLESANESATPDGLHLENENRATPRRSARGAAPRMRTVPAARRKEEPVPANLLSVPAAPSAIRPSQARRSVVDVLSAHPLS